MPFKEVVNYMDETSGRNKNVLPVILLPFTPQSCQNTLLDQTLR